MKLLDDLIIESNSNMVIVPSGTIMEEYDDYNLWIRIYFEFIDNTKIIDNKITEIDDTVEGARTDIDDWDEHNVLVYEGYFIGETTLSLSDKDAKEFIDSTGKSLNLQTFSDNLKEVINYPYFKKGIVEKALMTDINKAEGTINPVITDMSMNNGNVKVTFKVAINISITEDEPTYKRNYRTGGSYPDM